jgi:hypothetical protein
MRQGLVLVAVGVALVGCAPKKIPGTDLDDTSDTRAVLDLMRKYRSAVEARNVTALRLLAHESFRDDGGSSQPDDDLDYATMAEKLEARFSRVTDLRLDVLVRRIEFDDEVKRARVTYSYTMSFRMPEYSGKTQTENDLKQMILTRVGDQEWKIVSGI